MDPEKKYLNIVNEHIQISIDKDCFVVEDHLCRGYVGDT